jgi:hypothetical protein
VRRPVTTTEDETAFEALPVIPNVPILFPRGGGTSITWPLAAGDHVQLIFQTLSPQTFRETGEVSDAEDVRMHCLGNAYAIPGLGHDAQTLAHASLPALVIDHTDIRLGADATDYVALASLVTENFNRIKAAIQGATPVANDGGAALKTAILGALNFVPTFPIALAATKVKAK